jgi:hypothetical protein
VIVPGQLHPLLGQDPCPGCVAPLGRAETLPQPISGRVVRGPSPVEKDTATIGSGRFQTKVMVIAVLGPVLVVQAIETLGPVVAHRIDKR